MKYQNTLYVVDAMMHIVTPVVAGYLARNNFATLHRVTGGYDVTPVDLMDFSTDI